MLPPRSSNNIHRAFRGGSSGGRITRGRLLQILAGVVASVVVLSLVLHSTLEVSSSTQPSGSPGAYNIPRNLRAGTAGLLIGEQVPETTSSTSGAGVGGEGGAAASAATAQPNSLIKSSTLHDRLARAGPAGLSPGTTSEALSDRRFLAGAAAASSGGARWEAAPGLGPLRSRQQQEIRERGCGQEQQAGAAGSGSRSCDRRRRRRRRRRKEKWTRTRKRKRKAARAAEVAPQAHRSSSAVFESDHISGRGATAGERYRPEEEEEEEELQPLPPPLAPPSSASSLKGRWLCRAQCTASTSCVLFTAGSLALTAAAAAAAAMAAMAAGVAAAVPC